METGSAEVTVTVSDGRGRTASQTWNITITVQPPEITNPLPASSSEKPYRAQISGEYDLSITAEDPQDLPLTFTWTATGGALQDHPLETAKWTAPSEMGLAKVTVTVKNTFNLSSTHTWYFDVTNIVDVDEDITQPTTWLDGMVYEIRQDIEVKSTLTVQPGAIVKFADGCGLRIDSTGQIIAQGTAEKAIVFTSLNDDSHDGESNQNSGPAAAGAWGGVILNSNGNVFEHCEFYYGGSSDGTMLDLGATSGNTVTNCTFAYSEGVGLYAGQASGATITNNAFYGNYAPLVISVKLSLDDSNVFEPPSGGDANTRQGIFVSDAFGATFFDEAIEWGETEVAFVLAPGSDFYIERGTLKLYPGTTVKLSGNSLRVLTIGELTAVGTDAKPIVFTSINDDEYGGRSGCPYPPAAPQPGDWATIEIALHAGRCVFANCRIRYGGTEADYSNGDAALSVSSNDVGLGKIVFEYNLRGLDYLAYQAELDCSFSYNTYPARISMEVHTISVTASENTYNAVYLCDRPQAGGDKMWRTNCPLVLLDSIDLDGSTVHHEPGTIIKAGRDVTIRLGLGAGSISSTSLPSPRIWTKTTEAMWAWEKGRLQRATGKASTIKKRVYGFRAATFITPNTPNDRSLGQFLKAGAVRALCRAASAAWGRSLIDSQGYVCDNTK
jgi:parallel beta-helix repeat protein